MQLNMNIENNESRFKQVINDLGKLYNQEIIKFLQEWLTEIIFGCRVSEMNIEKIIRLVRNKLRYKTIKIKKVEINPETFSLKLITLYDIQNHKDKIK